jgi:hypothetical protein
MGQLSMLGHTIEMFWKEKRHLLIIVARAGLLMAINQAITCVGVKASFCAKVKMETNKRIAKHIEDPKLSSS